MGNYRKRPVEINAYHWEYVDFVGYERFTTTLKSALNGRENVPEWVVESIRSGRAIPSLEVKYGNSLCLRIKTLEGEMLLKPNDWLIMGVAGEIYPCDNDIFLKTYEKVEEGE